MFAGDDDEDRAVVQALLAYPPVAQELIAVVGDLVALQGGQGDDHELATRLLLEGRQLLRQLRLDLGREDVGVVDHPTGQLGELRRRLGDDRRRRQEAEEQAQQARKPAHWEAGAELGGGEPGVAPGTVVSKFTVGALWAAALAVNCAIGLALE